MSISTQVLARTVAELTAPGKGILAADESTGTAVGDLLLKALYPLDVAQLFLGGVAAQHTGLANHAAAAARRNPPRLRPLAPIGRSPLGGLRGAQIAQWLCKPGRRCATNPPYEKLDDSFSWCGHQVPDELSGLAAPA